MFRLAALLLAALLCLAPARAARDPFDPFAEPDRAALEQARHEAQVGELARLLGGVHALRALCEAPDAGELRLAMLRLLDAEAGPEPAARAPLAAAFNAGHRDAREAARSCGAEAVHTEAQLRQAAARLADALLAGNGG